MNISQEITRDMYKAMQFSIRLPEYIPYEPRIKSDYILAKPVGTECFIVAERPNSFKFYHITADMFCNKIPFLTINVPGVGSLTHTPTVLHGTLIRPTLCVIYDIIQRPNNAKEQNETRLMNLHKLMSYNPQLYDNAVMTFGVAHFIDVSASEDLLQSVNAVPYKIKHLEYKSYSGMTSNERQPISIELPPPPPSIEPDTPVDKYITLTTCDFILYADIYPDIYHIYTEEHIHVGVAHVPDYKTSVFLNSIFRSIKENANLDLLEESDDEDEFENTSPSKYVDLNKSAKMKCVYDEKFMKWMPIQLMVTYA